MLTVVIPVTQMSGKLDGIKEAIRTSVELGIKIIIVHDYRDAETSLELNHFVSEFKSNDRILLIEGHFGNPGSARNAGLAKVQSKYIAFWDSDDIPLPKEFLEFADQFEISEREFGISDYETVGLNYIEPFGVQGKSLQKNWKKIARRPGIWRWIFLTRIATDIQFPALRMGEDQVFLARYLAKASKAFVNPVVVYRYRINIVGQLTSNSDALKDLPAACLLLLKEFIKSRGTNRKILLVMLLRMIAGLRKINLFKLIRDGGS